MRSARAEAVVAPVGLGLSLALLPGCLITPWAFPTLKAEAPAADSGAADSAAPPPADSGEAPVAACAGAPDCDRIDNDCDGWVDEAGEEVLTALGYVDVDGDGFGAQPASSCAEPRVEVAGDCDDADARVYPGAVETCADGVINACEGPRATCAPEGGRLEGVAAWRSEAADGWVIERIVGATRGGAGPRVWVEASHPDAAAHLLMAIDADAGGPPVAVDPGLPVTHNFKVMQGPDGNIFFAGQTDTVGYRAMYDDLPGLMHYERQLRIPFGDPEAYLFTAHLHGRQLCSVGIMQEPLDGFVAGSCDPEVEEIGKRLSYWQWLQRYSGGAVAAPTSGFVGDVNGDGAPDLMMGRRDVAGRGIDLTLDLSSEHGPRAPLVFPTFISSSSGDLGSTLGAAGDVNGDGYGDVWVLDGGSAALGLPGGVHLYSGGSGLRGTSALTLTAQLTAPEAPPVTLELELAEGNDMDNDGFSDLVLPSGGAGLAGVWFGPVEGVHLVSSADVQLSVVGTGPARLGGDLNGDGAAELMLRDERGGVSLIWGAGY